MKNLRGMVLSAGLGNRLKPLTYMLAKPAVPFLGRPLIHYSLDMLTILGIKTTQRIMKTGLNRSANKTLLFDKDS